ncbi:MAG TPA: AMP-binding protein [Pseudomonadales bacterium]|jgi:acyl-CoA synthetase (AMP-forming)/AMP-acid ligase II|nr:AMP-binding protein [Pseudomonadales bacterium]MDP7314301.1 AMP-binding protein [Pseudomonadales bacterium]HJP49429.1 AMP-binding protein [Pseudomonadales bacterium]|tara:strand:- start:112 stop:1662 length:1551 start_codon:yes stop_codon:yes gene_type:complete
MKELIYHRHLIPAAEYHANRVAIIDGDYSAIYSQHLERVCRISHALRHQLSVERADRFAVMALNSHYFTELYHSAFLGAGIINPLNLRLAAKELVYILNDSGTKVCFVDAAFAPLIDQIRSEIKLERVVLMGEGDVPHDITMDALIDEARFEIPAEPEEQDPVVLMYTGGTTGLPKGVLLDQRAEILNLYHGLTTFPMTSDVVYLTQTPMFHAAAMFGILGASMGGLSVSVPLFDPKTVMEVIPKHQIEATVMVPTMIGMLLSHPDFSADTLASLKMMVYGASPMPSAILQRLREVAPHIELFQGYGMTESSSVLTILKPEDHLRDELRGSVGRALPGVVLSIQDEDGKRLDSGETGEVCARAGNYMIEYWNKQEATAEAFKDDWYHTGDAGYLNEEGFLFLVDRVKDMIISGGENIYSIEVEDAIASHPSVAQVAIIGIPHDLWGEAVHAVVVLQPDKTATEDEIIEHARASIAGFKVPKTVEFREEPLPLSGALKVLKRDLRSPYWEGKERRIN